MRVAGEEGGGAVVFNSLNFTTTNVTDTDGGGGREGAERGVEQQKRGAFVRLCQKSVF